MSVAFLSGASVLASGAIALFFLRYWRETHDRFFLFFAVAFAIFMVNRTLLTVLDDASEGLPLIYLARAFAFGLIVLAILDKNRAPAGE